MRGLVFILPLLPTWGTLGLVAVVALTLKSHWVGVWERLLNWVLALLGVWLLVSVVFARYTTEAILGTANFIPFLALFAAFSVLVETPTQLRHLCQSLVGAALLVAVLGLGQLLGGWTTPLWGSRVTGWVLLPGGNPVGRLSSVFIYANFAAAYLLVALLLGMGLWLQGWRSRRWGRCGLGLIGLGAIALALVLTHSRNAWGLAGLGILAYGVYLGWWWSIAVVGAAIASAFGAAFAPHPVSSWLRGYVPAYFWARLSDELYPDRPLALQRTTQWEFAWQMLRSRPLTGWGLRNFTPLYQEQMSVWLGHPHNLILMLGAETGVPGMLLLVGSVGWVMVQGVRLLLVWSALTPTPGSFQWRQDRLMLFSCILAFGELSLFNLVDVTLFDLRLNLVGWILLGSIYGVVYHHRVLLDYPQMKKK